MNKEEPKLLEEVYTTLIDGRIVKADFFGDLWVKDDFGVWVPFNQKANEPRT